MFKATQELQGRFGKLKVWKIYLYRSGIKALDDIAGELDENSESTFSDLNSEVSNHAHALEDVSNT